MATSSRQLVDKLRSISKQLQDLANDWEENGDEQPASDVAICINCGTRPQRSRGLCDRCYSRIMQRIRRKTMTEKQAVENGFLLADIKPGGAKPKNITALDKWENNRHKRTEVDEDDLVDDAKGAVIRRKHTVKSHKKDEPKK